jgi:hypothetical protein
MGVEIVPIRLGGFVEGTRVAVISNIRVYRLEISIPAVSLSALVVERKTHKR